MSRPRVVFMGTPEFAVPSLVAVAAACEVVAVVSQPERPRGRGLERTPTPVAQRATELGLNVLTPPELAQESARAELAALTPDLFAVVAFGAILTPELLAVPRLGSINLHGSLLPDYRGASPVQRALWDGRTTTGVTTLWMDEGIDTGDVILRETIEILEEDDAGTLAARLADRGAPLLARSLALAYAGSTSREPQDRAAGSYARKLRKEDGRVQWENDARTVWNHQRAVTPWPGAHTAFRGQRVRLDRARVAAEGESSGAPGTVIEIEESGVRVACGLGALRIERITPAGRVRLEAAAWARGLRLEVGERFHREESLIA